LRMALEPPGFCFVLRQVPSDEVVGEWLRPGWYLPDVEDTVLGHFLALPSFVC
jgi:hypothetical protein